MTAFDGGGSHLSDLHERGRDDDTSYVNIY